MFDTVDIVVLTKILQPTIDVSSKGKYSMSVTQEVDNILSQSSFLKSQIVSVLLSC